MNNQHTPLPKKIERSFRKKFISPVRDLINTYRRRNYPRVFGNSIPKAGTHLLCQIFLNMGFKNKNASVGGPNCSMSLEEIEQKMKLLEKEEILYGHRHFEEELNNILSKNKISHVLIVRDPRDVVVSLAFYLPKRPEQKDFPDIQNLSQHERLMACIKGIDDTIDLPSIAKRYKDYIPWLNDDNCLVIKFEDLIGSHGGGDDKKQLETLRRITEHVGISFGERELKEIASKTFNERSATFRKGQIGDWANWLDDDMLDILKKDRGIFEKFGYSI